MPCQVQVFSLELDSVVRLTPIGAGTSRGIAGYRFLGRANPSFVALATIELVIRNTFYISMSTIFNNTMVKHVRHNIKVHPYA